jgi:hypothetical protein
MEPRIYPVRNFVSAINNHSTEMKIEDEQKIYYHAVRSRRGVSVIGLPG